MLPGPDLQTVSIYAPVVVQLAQVEEQLHELCQTDIADLDPLLDYALRSGGKRVRPALTLLAAAFHDHERRRSRIMAAAVELLHLATLIHDDTVDNAGMRRGKPTINKLYGNHVAVLLGDYLFATSATFVCDTGVIRVIRRFSETIMELASGQLIEFFTTFEPAKARRLYEGAHLPQNRLAVLHFRRIGGDTQRRPRKPGTGPCAATATTLAWPFRLWTTCWMCRATPPKSGSR